MKKRISYIAMSALLISPVQTIIASSDTTHHPAPYTSTKDTLLNITPQQALKRLMDGNKRFATNKPITRNLLQQAKVTSIKGQFPSAVILSCMDSRGSPELLFDQGLGDVFSVRVAGNVIDADQLGGMEYATKVVGTKLIVVLGHTQCGAVGGACQGVELGNLTQLLIKIQPAVRKIKDEAGGKVNCSDYKTVDKIAKQNVLDMMKQVMERSPLIHDQIRNKKVLLVGAMHELETGKVTFFDENGTEIQ